jgi:DNA mismatch endonuclease (patch repair protein)
VDTFSKAKRSKIMASVKSNDAKSTELRFVPILRAEKISGWRRSYALTGSPDFVFPRLRVAVFLDGCFWHGCPEHCRMPASNTAYWNNKIEKNKKRDKKVTKDLKAKGWRVVRIWEHEIKSERLERKLNRIRIR